MEKQEKEDHRRVAVTLLRTISLPVLSVFFEVGWCRREDDHFGSEQSPSQFWRKRLWPDGMGGAVPIAEGLSVTERNLACILRNITLYAGTTSVPSLQIRIWPWLRSQLPLLQTPNRSLPAF